MKQATAVIGAAFGDEGKGLMTDYLVRRRDPARTVVVRYCGGAQAGHTVVEPPSEEHPGGRRHVFHHYGSGTLAGALTYLSREFLVNPAMWVRERQDLVAKVGHLRPLLVDAECRVTTPWDMWANQRSEESLRHGSCGMGVHATMVRHEHVPLFASDLWSRDLQKKLGAVQDYYGGSLALEWTDRFQAECREMAVHLSFAEPSILRSSEHVVFEGAQGLLLDEDSQFFPHVTHAKTGLYDVVRTCRDAGIEHVDAVYVTRSYLTRHGAGPLPGEVPGMSFKDDTNVRNEWQGHLRFAPLDCRLIGDAIAKDLSESAYAGVTIAPTLAVTHVDQHPFDNDEGGIFIRGQFVATGPTHEDVRETVG